MLGFNSKRKTQQRGCNFYFF